MNLEKYAYGHYRKHTVKQQGSDVKNAESKGMTAFVRDDPVKTLAVGLDGKRAEVSPLQYVPTEGLNTPWIVF